MRQTGGRLAAPALRHATPATQQMPISVPASKTREVPLYDPATRPASSLESPQMRSIARARRSLASCAIGLSSGPPASSKADSGSIADT
jgi:hypothetical protein